MFVCLSVREEHYAKSLPAIFVIFCMVTYYGNNPLIFEVNPTQSGQMVAILNFRYVIQGGPKLAQLVCMPQVYQILTDFSYFIVRIRRKFVIILSLNIPPRLKCVTTLPCEMASVLKATIDNKTTSVTTNNTF